VVSETRRDGAKSRGGSSSASILSVSVLVGAVALAIHGGAFLFLVTCAGAFVLLSVVAICGWTAREKRIGRRYVEVSPHALSDRIEESLRAEQEQRRKIRLDD